MLLFLNVSVSSFKWGINLWFVSMTAATCITVGKLSFEDYDLLTSSFGWTNLDPRSPPRISIALFAITSLAFIFDYVPEPVCQTTNGKCSSSLPCATSSDA